MFECTMTIFYANFQTNLNLKMRQFKAETICAVEECSTSYKQLEKIV